MKKAVAKSQFMRALRVSSDPTSAKRSSDMIHALFRANGYPSRWLNGVAHQAKIALHSAHHNRGPSHAAASAQPPRKERIYVSLPFIDDSLTRRVDSALKAVNLALTASWKNANTVKKRLVHSALEPPPCRAGNKACRTCDSGLAGKCTTKNVVYQITCVLCADSGGPSSTYIGETKRCIRYRFDEHFRDGANGTQQTPFGDHMNECHPNVSGPRLSVTILRRCKDSADRKIAEALAIRDKQPKLNCQLDTWSLL